MRLKTVTEIDKNELEPRLGGHFNSKMNRSRTDQRLEPNEGR